MESGQARIASLKNAARRDLFVSSIEKYEAKVRQEQKARAMLREQRAAATTVAEHRPPVEEDHSATTEKSVVREQAHPQIDIRAARQQNNDDSQEKKVLSDKHATSVEPCLHVLQMPRTDSSGVDAIISSAENLTLSHTTPSVKPASFEGRHANLCMDVKPLPAVMEVDIAAIAAALGIRIKAVDMAAPMQEHAFRCARDCLDALDKLRCKVVAHTLKKEFDKVYGPAWHCIVGTSFGSYVTHSLGGFVYFSLDKVSVLLFKTAVEPIDC